MLIVRLAAWLLLVLPFAVLVGRGIALGSQREEGAVHPLELPVQARARAPQPTLVQLSG